MLQKYLENLFKTAQTGDAREESYYPDLKTLFEQWIEKSGKGYHVTALIHTLALQAQIDKLYPKIEQSSGYFKLLTFSYYCNRI